MIWNKHFVTGISIVDEQHQWLIDLINTAAPVLVLNYQRDHARAESLLDQLVSYAAFHFETEDRLMREYAIDARHYQRHLESHAKFSAAVARMRAAYTSGHAPSGSALLAFLANWLVYHILGEDQALARQIRAIEAGASPDTAYDSTNGSRQEPSHEAMTHTLLDLYTMMTEQNRELIENNYELEAHRERLEELIAERTADLAKALDAAETANRARNAFIANMSHEIRTPMNAIVGLTWSLRQNAKDSTQVARLNQIGDATQQLLTIINDLLDMARLESHHLRLEALDFEPARLLQEVYSSVESKAQAKGLKLRLTVSDLPTRLRGDPIRLGQILSNFASNATKFTERGHVEIRARQLPDENDRICLRFEVEDTGPGIETSQLPRLFEPFEQLDTSSTRSHGGTGLGLAISKRLADMMEGRIGVESTPGQGSTFWLEVRLQVVATAVGDNDWPDQVLPGSAGSSVLNREAVARYQETLRRLATLLADDDVQAVSLWHESAADLRTAFDGRAAPFEAALIAYDFAAAHALLADTLAELEHFETPD